MNQQLSAKAANFQKFLSSRGIEEKVVELSESTRTAAEAAAAIGCEVEEIAKSIVFYVKDTLRPILVIASGTNRVDEKKLKKLVGGKLKRADADFVREVTGFVIGGVPPAGHIERCRHLWIWTFYNFHRSGQRLVLLTRFFPSNPRCFWNYALLKQLTSRSTDPVKK